MDKVGPHVILESEQAMAWARHEERARPQLGEIHINKWRCKFVWVACLQCGKERWVQLLKGKPRNPHCRKCFADERRNSWWKGGSSHKNKAGYVLKRLAPNDPFYGMVFEERHPYVMEHRYVMAQQLGRCLMQDEKVHHINGIKDDNRPGNLELISQSSHSIRTMLCSKCPLQKEIKLLRWQIRELTEKLRADHAI